MIGVPVGYVLLLLLFFVFFSLSLYFGFREWRQPSDAAPLAMDVDYVRVENYFGQSFRAKMREWLAAAEPNGVAAGDLAGAVQRVAPGGEHLLLLPGGRIDGSFGGRGRDAAGADTIIYSEGDLSLAGGAVFPREIYSRGNLASERAVHLQAVAADGEMILGPDNEVARWVDAQGPLRIQSGSVVGSRASSSVAIELEPGVLVQSLYAPIVTTDAAQTVFGGEAGNDSSFAVSERFEAGRGGPEQGGPPEFLKNAGGLQMEPGTWRVQGDLHVPAGSCLGFNLIVKGTLRTDPGCLFLKDVKAASVKLGERNHVVGNLTSADQLELGTGSFVERSVAAGTDARLAAGVRVGRPELQAAVSAGGEIILEQNVTVCGKVSAGKGVRTV